MECVQEWERGFVETNGTPVPFTADGQHLTAAQVRPRLISELLGMLQPVYQSLQSVFVKKKVKQKGSKKVSTLSTYKL